MGKGDDDLLNDRERARVTSREKKGQKPKVIAVNPGMRKLQLQLAERLRKKTDRQAKNK